MRPLLVVCLRTFFLVDCDDRVRNPVDNIQLNNEADKSLAIFKIVSQGILPPLEREINLQLNLFSHDYFDPVLLRYEEGVWIGNVGG